MNWPLDGDKGRDLLANATLEGITEHWLIDTGLSPSILNGTPDSWANQPNMSVYGSDSDAAYVCVIQLPELHMGLRA